MEGWGGWRRGGQGRGWVEWSGGGGEEWRRGRGAIGGEGGCWRVVEGGRRYGGEGSLRLCRAGGGRGRGDGGEEGGGGGGGRGRGWGVEGGRGAWGRWWGGGWYQVRERVMAVKRAGGL